MAFDCTSHANATSQNIFRSISTTKLKNKFLKKSWRDPDLDDISRFISITQIISNIAVDPIFIIASAYLWVTLK